MAEISDRVDSLFEACVSVVPSALGAAVRVPIDRAAGFIGSRGVGVGQLIRPNGVCLQMPAAGSSSTDVLLYVAGENQTHTISSQYSHILSPLSTVTYYLLSVQSHTIYVAGENQTHTISSQYSHILSPLSTVTYYLRGR